MRDRRSVIYIILISLLLYSLLTLSFARVSLGELRVREAALLSEYTALEERNASLKHDVENCRSDENMERLARDKLGLVYPGETVFYFLPTNRED